MPNYNPVSAVVKSLIVVFVLSFLVSACSGGSLSQAEPANLSAQLRAKQSLPGQEPAKQAQSDAQAREPDAGNSQPPNGAPAAAKAAAAPSDAPEAAQPAPVALAQEVPAAPAEAAPKSAPAVDLSIPAQPKVGFRAPDFALQTLSGESVRLSDLVGRPVVISYWATWCIPCQQELPILQRLAQEFESQGLVVVTVNAIDQDNLQDVQAMLSDKGMSLPVLLDQGGQFASTYGALFFPTTIFVDASGVIRYIRLGDSSEADLRTKIENLLAGSL